MLRYVTGRLASALLLALGVATLAFALVHLAPGDSGALDLLSGSDAAAGAGDDEAGLVEQYGAWLSQLVRGDLGISAVDHVPVARILGAALPHTLALSAAGLLLAVLFGVSTGVVQAARAGSLLDRALSLVTVTLYSAPSFWVGIVVAALFVRVPRALFGGAWFPLTGAEPPGMDGTLLDFAHYLVLPAVTLGLVVGSGLARFTRVSMLEVLSQDYIRTARAKGLGEWEVLLRHGLRNALLPVISLLGVSVPVLFTGTVFIEAVFARQGVGLVMLRAIQAQDMGVVVAGALLFGIVVVCANLVVDLLYGWADPRLEDHGVG